RQARRWYRYHGASANSQAATLGNVMRRHDEVAGMQTGDGDVLQRKGVVAERDQGVRRVGRTLHRVRGQPVIDIVGFHDFGEWPWPSETVNVTISVCDGSLPGS